MHFTLYL